jgi:hypothetical protein
VLFYSWHKSGMGFTWCIRVCCCCLWGIDLSLSDPLSNICFSMFYIGRVDYYVICNLADRMIFQPIYLFHNSSTLVRLAGLFG